MKALTYHGPHHVQVENVPDPGVEQADDIILRITATAICGSDLHLYRGKIPQVKHGDIFGHEFMGEVVETGKDVKNLQKGDRVVIPGNDSNLLIVFYVQIMPDDFVMQL
ncbi:alcohol dehydrogenase catalytic domain-containing protein, partial [Escherichia coli]|uniref:alcohol dehydrogenase catalytic domain-containing protein n=1 Tax=Escherichia coli TaxID=562 RepID=UPI002079D251